MSTESFCAVLLLIVLLLLLIVLIAHNGHTTLSSRYKEAMGFIMDYKTTGLPYGNEAKRPLSRARSSESPTRKPVQSKRKAFSRYSDLFVIFM